MPTTKKFLSIALTMASMLVAAAGCPSGHADKLDAKNTPDSSVGLDASTDSANSVGLDTIEIVDALVDALPLDAACDAGGACIVAGKKGPCANGRISCSAGAEFSCFQVTIAEAETCDGKDNNCSGKADDMPAQSCYTGPAGTQGKGICKAGTEDCIAGKWGPCQNEVLPSIEACDNKDNNCDGIIDENLSKTCYTGAAGTLGKGACKAGMETCTNGQWGACQNQVLPSTETCDNKDNNCDGIADENLSKTCYTGAAGTLGKGVCKAGMETCTNGLWGACQNQVLPSTETCDNKDNNCDGIADENLSKTCYTGAAGALGKGVCKAGKETCANGLWGACQNQVLPSTETCDNKDNNCDGIIDGLLRSCYTGPSGTLNKGVCRAGVETCTTGRWGACQNQVLPSAETCDNKDNNCDGIIDGFLQSCYTGPSGTLNKGICKAGTQTCTAGTLSSCLGQTLPTGTCACGPGDCDCDGQVDPC